MAEVYRSSAFGAKEETTEGTLIALGAANFIPIREGFSFQGNLETISSNELSSDIGASKSFSSKESPSCEFPKYLKHSGTEGQAPEYAVLIKSAIGAQTDNSTEYSTSGTSVAGTATTRGSLEMGSDQEDNFVEGQAVLIKDATNGYSIRNVYNVDSSGNQLDLNFNMTTAAPTGTALGKAIHFRPASTGHPSYSAYHYQASTSSAFYQAMAGCRTTSMSLNFTANQLAECNFSFEGTRFYLNPITITASSNDALDFDDGLGEENATIDPGVYNPVALAREIEDKMNALTADTITVTYHSHGANAGKFVLASSGGTFTLKWNTGANTGTTIGGSIGFAVAADDSGATTYTGDNVLTYSPAVTPTYDSSDSLVVKSGEIMLGTFSDNICRPVSTASVTIATPKTDILSMCEDSGIDSSITNQRTVTFSATMALEEHEVHIFDDFINNTTTSVMINVGEKSAGNWVAGKCLNVYLPNLSLTADRVAENDGYVVFELEGTGFVTSSNKDVHINFL